MSTVSKFLLYSFSKNARCPTKFERDKPTKFKFPSPINLLI